MKCNFDEAFGLSQQDDSRASRRSPAKPQATQTPTDRNPLHQHHLSTPAVSASLESYHFDGDSENQYASGPARIVHVKHEGKDVPALLLSWDLSQQLQIAAQAMRQVFRSKHRKTSQRAQLDTLEQRLQARRDQLHIIERYHRQVDRRGGELDEVDRKGHDLDCRLAQVQLDRRFIDHRHYELSHRTFAVHGRIARALEPLLLDCGLLHPTPDFPDATHWDHGFDSRLKALDSLPDLSCEVEEAQRYLEYLIWDRERHRPSDKPPSLAAIAEQEYRHAARVCRQAADNFRLWCGREDDVVAWRQQQPVFENPGTVSEQDREALVNTRALTRHLIDAEAAVREAKRKAVDVGFDRVSDNQTSIFGLGQEAGATGWDRGPVYVMMDRERIERWREGVDTENEAY